MGHRSRAHGTYVGQIAKGCTRMKQGFRRVLQGLIICSTSTAGAFLGFRFPNSGPRICDVGQT